MGRHKLPIIIIIITHGAGISSIGEASDWHAAEAVSIPWCGKGFFWQSQLSVQTLLRRPYSPRGAVACFNIYAHVKDPEYGQPYHCLDIWKHRTQGLEWPELPARDKWSAWKQEEEEEEEEETHPLHQVKGIVFAVGFGFSRTILQGTLEAEQEEMLDG